MLSLKVKMIHLSSEVGDYDSVLVAHSIANIRSGTNRRPQDLSKRKWFNEIVAYLVILLIKRNQRMRLKKANLDFEAALMHK